jgi:hypothetical protein
MSKVRNAAFSGGTKPNKPFKIAFGLFVVVWVLFGVPGAVKDLSLGYQSENWSKVSAVVTRAYWRDSARHDLLTPYITYQYEVNGRTYTSDRFAFDENQHYDPGDVQGYIHNDVPGAIVTARYNPADPSVAVLVPGGQTAPAIMLLMALVFSLTAVWIWRK